MTNPYQNYSFIDLISVIKENKFLPDTSIADVSNILPIKILDERDGILLVRTLRKENFFEEAEIFHDKLKKRYPSSEGLKMEALWLLFSSKVCNNFNKQYKVDALQILDATSQTDPKTKLIYEITALICISRLLKDNQYIEAYKLITKLNPSALSDKGREGNNGIFYPSNKQQYYNYKAKSLIGMNKVESYINWVFEYLGFSKQKKEEFVSFIIASCKYKKYNGSILILDAVLSNYLYLFDLDLTLKSSYLPSKSASSNNYLLSELSQYSFCPVSYVLNKSYSITSRKPLDLSTKWIGTKDGFYDRYLKYNNGSSIDNCFQYYSSIYIEGVPRTVIMEENSLAIFEELFKGSIIINNHLDNVVKTLKSDDGQLVGAPDYLIRLANGKLVAISEKFSKSSSVSASKIYNSDVIALEAYLTKFRKQKINYAYLINWNWSIENIPNQASGPDIKKLFINKVQLHLVEAETSRENLINQVVDKIEALKTGKTLQYSNLGFANKCLNCSVYSYCEHKNGNKKKLHLPYNA
ncbi:hypothetical protein VBZ51_08310 [Maribacter sp. HS]|uniref:hypothetical protein n=1 Tax=Maribacter sp. HS TaxID=3110480 RepID=UPI003A882427